MTHVGALLEAKPFHPTRKARNHLRMLAAANGIPVRRVDEVLEQLGLAAVARKKPRTFSLGMGQRLGLAAALLGDPHTLVLDEPANGLDPQGIQWIRELLKGFAASGRSVFVSSHLLSEMALMADQLVVIGRGRLIASGPVEDFVRTSTRNAVVVRSPQAADLVDVLRREGAAVEALEPGSCRSSGWTPPGSATSRSRPRSGCTSCPTGSPPWRRRSWRPPRTPRSTRRTRSRGRGTAHDRRARLRVDPDPDHPLDLLALGDRGGLRRRPLVPGRRWALHFSLGSANPPAASELTGVGQGIATQFAVFGVPYFVAYVLAMVAVFGWGHEYRHGMIRATLTALSSRTAAWVAKFLVVGAWVVVVALVTALASLLVGWLWLHGDGVPVFTADVWRAVARTLLYTLLFAWLAVGVHRAGAQPDRRAGAAVPVAAGRRERGLGGVLAGARAARPRRGHAVPAVQRRQPDHQPGARRRRSAFGSPLVGGGPPSWSSAG